MRIFLIGFMGCGKSHSGRALAQRLGYRFLDLDDRIEEQAGMTIANLFASEGEEGFRRRERQALLDMAGFDHIVVACGGGAPCFFDNMTWMNEHGLTIYLEAPPALLAQRLFPGREHRPLISALSETELPVFIERKLAERRAYYEQARLTIRQAATHEDLTEGILALIERQKP